MHNVTQGICQLKLSNDINKLQKNLKNACKNCAILLCIEFLIHAK
jgi:hypothetical protein